MESYLTVTNQEPSLHKKKKTSKVKVVEMASIGHPDKTMKDVIEVRTIEAKEGENKRIFDDVDCFLKHDKRKR